MIIFHAGFKDNRLCLWGESPPSVITPPRGRRSKGGIEQLAYDAGRAGLSSALKEVASTLSAETEIAAIWLPAIDRKPLVSSPLIADPPSATARPELAAWTIIIIPLPISDTLELLCSCVGREMLANRVIIGRDLAFWATAMRFAGSLVARQQYLPGLQPVGGTYRARWEPLISGDDARRLPDEIEQAFRDAGLSLFPAKIDDLQTECSCPDWSNLFLGERSDNNDD
jgi:hypothetical protein